MKKKSRFSEEQAWEYNAKQGTKFVTRCDFKGGITVIVSDVLPNEKLLADVAEMTAYHCMNVRPDLKDFCGYRRVVFTIKRT